MTTPPPRPSSGRITPLSRPASTALRSSLVVPTYPSVLQELVHNSLDAEASSITIWVDASSGHELIRVEDDGCGIRAADLSRTGRRYESSKEWSGSAMGSACSYGFRGEALSSIAALSLVDITTRARDSRRTMSKVIKGSKVLYEGQSNRSIAGPHGTVVTVKDLFHNVPVRQKALKESGSLSTVTACRKVVEALALVRPNVTWSVWEESAIGSSSGGAKQVLHIAGAGSSLDVYRTIYGRAAVERVQNIRVTAGRHRVDGFISLEGLVSKSHQHLYVNSFPIERGELHQAISERFARSRFSTLTQDAVMEQTGSQQHRRSPRRLERYPVYVLDVTIPPEDVDALYEPRKKLIGYKDVDAVLVLLLAVVDEFLKKHHFLSGRLEDPEEDSPIRASTRQRSETPIVPSPLRARSGPGTAASPRAVEQPSYRYQTPSPSRLVPSAKHISRTSATKRTTAMMDDSTLITSSGPIKRKRDVPNAMARGGDTVPEDADGCDWLRELLAKPRSRSATPRAGFGTTRLSLAIAEGDEDEVGIPQPECGPSALVNISDRLNTLLDVIFSASALDNVRILRQVDRKFIACVLSSDAKGERHTQRTLVVIDQHAADERVSVERLQKELCEGFISGNTDMTGLKTAVMVVLSGEEAAILRRPGVIDVFARWGIQIDLPEIEAGSDTDYAQIFVTAVPTVLIGRLGKKEASEMTRLIKLYLAALDRSLSELHAFLTNVRSSGTNEKAEDSNWSRATRWMPQEMVELVNSKACRGAIMFGDKLDHEQCERLIRQLRGCRHPFICAHGRPSLVPLFVLGDGGCRMSGGAGSGGGRVDWKAWKGRTRV